MPLSAWLMFIFGSLILYGGLGICIAIAIRGGKKQKSTNEETSKSE